MAHLNFWLKTQAVVNVVECSDINTPNVHYLAGSVGSHPVEPLQGVIP